MPALDIDYDEVRDVFETNLFAVMRLTNALIPALIAAKGKIVQIGSVAGITPYVFGSVYNASKAALHSYSNTLRVELEPFGVRVVVIVTGGVKSRIARVDRALPEDSRYEPLTKEYERRLKHSQENAMPNEAYAKSVVKQVLYKNPVRWVWEGNLARTIWFVETFFPKRIWVSRSLHNSPLMRHFTNVLRILSLQGCSV
jgi:1-acylglycerone phosphate reductase